MSSPRIIKTEEADFAKIAASILFDSFTKIDNPVISFPAGITPLGIYHEFSRHYADQKAVWNRMRYLSLDDYAGLHDHDERLFKNWLGQILLDPLGIQQRLTFNSKAANSVQEAERMQAELQTYGGIDIIVLGLGVNGHLAFNEPGSAFDSRTRLVDLSKQTIESNAQYWGGDQSRVPQQGYTLGLGDIMKARQIYLLVTGTEKAAILDRVINGSISEDIPASILQRHQNVTIIADKSALSKHRELKHG